MKMSLFDDRIRELMDSINEKAKEESEPVNTIIEISKPAERESAPAEVPTIVPRAPEAPSIAPRTEEISRVSATGLPGMQNAETDYLLAKKQAEDDLAKLLAKFGVKEAPPSREITQNAPGITPDPPEAVPEIINIEVNEEPAQAEQLSPIQKLKKQNRRNWKDIVVISLIVAAMLVIPFVIYRLIV